MALIQNHQFLKYFSKYPNVKLNIDLISDWEFVYLKNEKIKFVFKTDKANRIGIYGEDLKAVARKMKRGKMRKLILFSL